jgi:transposase-like protein
MDTQLATSQIRMRNWVAVIRDQKTSGLTIKDYCQEHGLSENAYYYWLRKSRRAALQATGISFAEVPVPDQQTASPDQVFIPQLTVRIGRALINVDSSTPKQLLAMACEVLSDAQ